MIQSSMFVKISRSLALLGLLFCLACETTGLTPAPELAAGEAALNVDGDNDTAPFLAAGNYEAGVRFSASQLGNYVGGELVRIQYYMANRPGSATLRIYEDSGADGPGNLLYSQGITSEIVANTWNEHTLDVPFTLGDKDLWITLVMNLTQGDQTLGCDPGPNVNGGDLLFDSADGLWESLLDRSNGEVNINWNLRAVVKL
ncbi:MAG: hypothetical protein AAFR61_10820 [Bacteroidota bacterium]